MLNKHSLFLEKNIEERAYKAGKCAKRRKDAALQDEKRPEADLVTMEDMDEGPTEELDLEIYF